MRFKVLFSEAEGAYPNSPDSKNAVRLVFAHLALTVVSLGIALALEGFGRDLTIEETTGLYWTVVAAFGTTIVSALMLRGRHASRSLLPFQLATDVGIVTSLVYFSGGRESIFTFLYVIVTLYAAVLFGRRGAMISASASAGAYGVMLVTTQLHAWRYGVETEAAAMPWAATVAIWAVHVGALYLVGVLASFLASELQRTGRALDRSADDLRRLRDLHKRTVESLMSGLLTLDADGVVTWFNPEAERITGRSFGGAVGRPIDELIPGAEALLNSACPVEGRAPVPRARLAYCREDGVELHLGVAASILRGAEGEEAGHVVIFQDVTSVVAMERDLRRSERLAAVGEMAAKIAHEIRNPLASISGSIQLLRGGGAELVDPESGRLMDIVVRETDRLNGLITDFLLYSRPSPPNKKEVVARSILEEVTQLLQGTVRTDISMDVQGPDDLLVSADPAQLRQVLWNLASNALEAMPEGGELALSVSLEEADQSQESAAYVRNGSKEGAFYAQRVRISVRDSGEGMCPEVREQIFEPFFTTKKEGTGLGLATVYRIAESHGGEIEVESKVGFGTAFHLLLPHAMQEVR